MRVGFFVLAAAACCSLAHADVVELTDSNFKSELEKSDAALVMFYAPWCGHCKRIKPEFEKASADLARSDPPVQLFKVDCTESGKDTCGEHGVQGYPTLKIFRDGGVSSDYNGPREAAGIVKHMKSQVGPSSKELSSDSDFTKYLESANEVVIAAVLEKSDDMEAFHKAASILREKANFVHSAKSTSVRKSGVRLHRPKRLQSKFEDADLLYDGEMEKSAIEKWITANYHGLAGHRTPDNSGEFSAKPLVIAYYAMDYAKNLKGTNYWRNRIMKVAKEFSPRLSFAVSSRDDFQHELGEFGLESGGGGDGKPVVAVRSEDGKKYVMEDEFDMESFKRFLESYEAGKLEAHLKSEPVPEANDSGVKVAVAKNFDELVTNSENDVLIEFYAPWCGHCKSLAPIYDELGEKMANENVEIVKMDATANDVPSHFEVRGFPTLFWVKKGSKPTSYGGGRTVDDFVKYIAKEATEELSGWDRSGKEKKTEL